MTSKAFVDTPVGSYEGSAGNITTSTGSVTFAVGEAGGAICQFTGTGAGHNATFEGTLDGTSWFTIPGWRTDTGARATTTGVIAGNGAHAYRLALAGLAAFRIRGTALTSGAVTWTVGFHTLPIVAA